MEIRVLRYFLEVAREGNITRAAAYLHISQPTLSRQIKELEEELGKKLFVRSNYSVKLTEEGMLLRKRAEDILDMVDKTTEEFRALDEINGGDIRIGKSLHQRYPNIRCHIYSSGTEAVNERLDRGLLDFAVIVQEVDLSRYNYLRLPVQDAWGVLMRKDDPLARQTSVRIQDLLDKPLICSRQSLQEEMVKWFGDALEKLNLVATYDLMYNASILTREGLGYTIGFQNLVDTGADSVLCVRPLEPPLASPMYFIWKKYQVFTPVASLLLEELKRQIAREPAES